MIFRSEIPEFYILILTWTKALIRYFNCSISSNSNNINNKELRYSDQLFITLRTSSRSRDLPETMPFRQIMRFRHRMLQFRFRYNNSLLDSRRLNKFQSNNRCQSNPKLRSSPKLPKSRFNPNKSRSKKTHMRLHKMRLMILPPNINLFLLILFPLHNITSTLSTFLFHFVVTLVSLICHRNIYKSIPEQFKQIKSFCCDFCQLHRIPCSEGTIFRKYMT